LREADDLRLRFALLDFRLGTFAPFSRASLSAIAIACFRLRTFRPEPLFSVPRLRRRIVDSTFFDAASPYLAMKPPPMLFVFFVLPSPSWVAKLVTHQCIVMSPAEH
jgi:hypothetical protein